MNVATAAHSNCQPGTPVVGDVDGDGSSDLVVGLPGGGNGTGEIDLRLTTAPSNTLTQEKSGLGSGAQGDAFGAAVVLADLNDDGCSDIIVGAPEQMAARERWRPCRQKLWGGDRFAAR